MVLQSKSFFYLFLISVFSIPASFAQTDKGQEIPLIFRENKGQWKEDILFKANSHNAQICFSKDKISFTHSRPLAGGARKHELEHLQWSMKFEHAENNPEVSGQGMLASKTNYLFGSTQYKNIPDYSEILYENIYRNIDLRYYAHDSHVKYDYILKPNARVQDIQVKCEGIEKLYLEKGELHLKHRWGVITEKKPYSYQWIDGKQKEVNISYRIINGNTFGFSISGDYDRTKDIILDPVTLTWGTYVGGTDLHNGGYLYDLTTDPNGDIYATGYYPNTFPTTPFAYDETFNGGYGDAFVFKLSSDGTSLLYATYLGGNDDDRGMSIAVNRSGEAFVTGYTASASTSFPSTKTFGAILTGKNVFVTKLSADGSSLIYSAYMGGLNHDIGNGIVIDDAGNAYVAGETQSSNFPVTPGAFDITYNGGPSDGFVLKLNASGSALNYSSFLGGNSDDRARALQIGPSSEVFITGVTRSSDYPTSAIAYDKTFNGDNDIFVTKLTTDGSTLVYSTYVGGLAAEEGTSIDINAAGDAFFTGYTYSPNYPSTVFSPLNGICDVVVTRLSASGKDLIYSRYIGGSESDEGTSIIVNTQDQAFVAGTSKSLDFPLVLNGIDDPDPSRDKEYQVFVLMLGETGAQIKKSIKLGGSYDDYKIPSLSFPDKRLICDVVIGFTSHSPDLPTGGGVYQKKKLNGDQANDQPAVFKLYFGPEMFQGQKPPKEMEACDGEMITLSATCVSDPDYPCNFSWEYGGAIIGTSSSVTFKANKKDTDVILTRTNGCQSQGDQTTLKFPRPFKPVLDTILCKGTTISISGDGVTNEWFREGETQGVIANPFVIDTPGKYFVRKTNECNESQEFPFKVTGADKPQVDLGPDKTYCFPGQYLLDAFSQSTIDNDYLWSTGNTNSSISIETGGHYWVSVSNQCGSANDYIIIEELHKPVVHLGNDTSICLNFSITLHAGNPGLPKLWSNGATTESITVTQPGTYWVEVTNACATTRDDIVVKYSKDVPVINLGEDKMICSPFVLTLDPGANTGSNYYWSTGDTTRQITVTRGGTYFVTVTNGCGIDRDTIEITAPPALALDLGPDVSLCAPATLTLKAGKPGGNATYKWSNNASTPSITVNSTGKYWVKVTNACGSASDTIAVKVETSIPTVNLGRDTSICSNVDFALNAGNVGASYLWNTGAIAQKYNANIAVKDTFWVDVTNACGTTRDSIVLDIMPDPVVNLGRDTSICAPATLTLNVFNTGATYKWNTNATTSSVTVSATGIYYVDVTRCHTVRDSIVVTANINPPAVRLGRDTVICHAFTMTLDAGNHPGATYTWAPFDQKTRQITVNEGRMYIAKVKNGCGTGIDSINIISQPYENLGPDFRACKADTLTLDAGNEWSSPAYLWSTNETTRTIQVSKSGVYSVNITNVCGTINDVVNISMDTVTCVVDLGPDQRICAPASVTFDAGNDGSSYLWSTGAITKTITADTTGLYKVWVTNGCGTTPDSVYLLVDKSAPSVNLGPDRNVCHPVNLFLDGKNASSVHKWYPKGETTQKIHATTPGLYAVKVSNACGTDSSAVRINEFFLPKVALGNDTAVCVGPLTLDAGNAGDQYFWSTRETSRKIDIVSTGKYWLSVSNVCGIVSDSIYVVVDHGNPQVSLGKDTMICSPYGLTLHAGTHPMANILWSPGNEIIDSILVKQGGKYSVTVVNSCGTTTDEIEIAPNPVIVQAVPDTAICPGNPVNLYTPSIAGYSYKWTPGTTLNRDDINDPVATPDTTTNYVVLASDGTCTNADTATVIVYPIVNPEIRADVVEGYLPLEVHFSNPNVASGMAWFFGDGDSSSVANPAHTYTKEGIYTVVLKTTTSHGCIEFDTVQIAPFTLFIPNLITPNGDNRNDRFDLTNSHVWLRVEIFNRWGERVYIKEEGYMDDWDGSGCSDGVYYYHILDTKFGREFKGWVHLVRTVPFAPPSGR